MSAAITSLVDDAMLLLMVTLILRCCESYQRLVTLADYCLRLLRWLRVSYAIAGCYD